MITHSTDLPPRGIWNGSKQLVIPTELSNKSSQTKQTLLAIARWSTVSDERQFSSAHLLSLRSKGYGELFIRSTTSPTIANKYQKPKTYTKSSLFTIYSHFLVNCDTSSVRYNLGYINIKGEYYQYIRPRDDCRRSSVPFSVRSHS